MWDEYNKTTRIMVPDEHLVRFIQKTFPDVEKRKSIKILDAGFASGRHLVYLTEQGFDVSGFDYSEESIKFATRWLKHEGLLSRVDIKKADMLNLPYKNNSFDIFIEIGMIEHFFWEDREKAIAEVYRVLKPGGIFFFNVKKIGDYLIGGGPETEKNTYLINEPFIQNTPFHFFAESELKELLKMFRDTELNYVIISRNNMSIETHNWIAIAKK